MSHLSPAPGTPQTSDKAVVGGGISGVIAYVMLALLGSNIQAIDWRALVGAVLTAVGTGIATYFKANRPTTGV